jgi:TolA-binding protein
LEPRPAEIAFNQGWNALRSGDALAAAKTFERAIQAAGSDPIAEDAGFWRAISYQRAGKNLEALGALKLFLSRFPGSQRVGEASVMLGWEFFKFGELEDAKLYFRAALADRVSAVRQSARKGLQAIDTRAAQAAYNNR